MNYLITYEDALKICEAHKNFNFYKTEHRIDDYRIVTFNYFLCDYKMFANPLRDESGINAFDVRGVTFVFDKNGVPTRFLMLKKFFNVNQIEDTQLDVLRTKKIKHVTIKEDGSLIAFMNLPNGTIFAKTQAGFTNEQSSNAMQLYNHQKGIKEFVDDALEAGMTPLFEYVAYDNRIVLKYAQKELRLIGIRDNDNGNYFSAAEMLYLNERYGIPAVKTMEVNSLDELEKMMKTTTDMEGVVVEFDDEQLVKWKTVWYFNLHGIRTMNIFREDYVINNYLTEKLDDVTQELNMNDDADAFKFIDRVKNSVNNWSNYIEDEVNKLVDAYNSSFYFNNWAKFATDKHKSGFFGLARKKIELPEEYNKYKINFMLNAAKHLHEAKHIIEKYENTNFK